MNIPGKRIWNFILSAVILICNVQTGYSQNNTFHGYVESGILGGTEGSIPFWMLANRYGRFTPRSINSYADIGIFSDTLKRSKKFGWDWGMEVFARYDGKPGGSIQQGYIGGKAWFLYLFAGIKEEHFGTQDPDLTSGFLLWSGNAKPLPEISLATDGFVKVPYTKGFVEVDAGFAHGWFGNEGYVEHSYLHHAHIYLKFGGTHSFHLTAGIHHFAQWGGISPVYGPLPSGLKNFIKVIFGQTGGDSISGVPYNEWKNSYGNHLGTKDISLDYRFPSGWKIKGYWQNFIEDITGLGYRNISDGLWGMQVEKPDKIKIGYEYLRSITGKYKIKNGALEGGVDDYFNNSIYQSGWTYKGYTIGNPLLTSPILLPGSGYPDYVRNNRIVGHILNMEYISNSMIFRVTYSYTINYGCYILLYNPPLRQQSMLIGMQMPIIMNKLIGTFSLGYDAGNLLNNHFGAGLSLRWNFGTLL